MSLNPISFTAMPIHTGAADLAVISNSSIATCRESGRAAMHRCKCRADQRCRGSSHAGCGTSKQGRLVSARPLFHFYICPFCSAPETSSACVDAHSSLSPVPLCSTRPVSRHLPPEPHRCADREHRLFFHFSEAGFPKRGLTDGAEVSFSCAFDEVGLAQRLLASLLLPSISHAVQRSFFPACASQQH